MADPVGAPSRLVAGLDLGSTSLKMLVTDEAGTEIGAAQVPTPWRSGPGGSTEMTAEALLDAVWSLIGAATHEAAKVCPAPIAAVAIAGMAETGMVIDAGGAAVAPGMAWFDPRGAEQAAALPPGIRHEFAGRTGLPLGAQVSVAKLAWLRDQGVSLTGRRWLNLPEFVAAALGGRTALELSLTSRTGLLDQDTGHPWPQMLDALGLDEAFLPPLVDAGSPFGEARAGTVPDAMAGALLTVAGHDHLVAAEATGGLPADHYHVSMGTAEVLLRVIDAPLGYAARRRLADHLINEVRHVVPGKHVLVAGVKTGLLLRRVLQTAGIHDRRGRDDLDGAVMALPYEGLLPGDAIEVSGARNDDGVLHLTVRTDGVSPAEVFGAVLRHSNDEISLLIEAMDRELPPAVTATLTGGWAGMAAVRRARARVLPSVTASARDQETAYGATRSALRLLSTTPPKIGTAP
ncbi:FGGY family carbohydrate kinase [Paractinoplanes hotanensis]|uniref:FGGY family carbohydrate kinase n=1 Tax=Paractinoplanes hotanensis TaxID=2906497 RepID=A0ABT0Y3Z8_9ACTN|nr:FGGY family carbohydrate kinase [Actinoplanes hotanensis]MCM4080768.1 FGGY family carbohydrate kinase [Actinoplanes hotanensis]